MSANRIKANSNDALEWFPWDSIETSPKTATVHAPQNVEAVMPRRDEPTAATPTSRATVADASVTVQIHHQTIWDVAQAAVAAARTNSHSPPAAADSLRIASMNR